MVQKSLLLGFPAKISSKPVLSSLVNRFELIINIIQANITIDEGGRMLVILEGDKDRLEASIKFLKEMDVKVQVLQKKIMWSEELCVHCGACIGQCNYGSLSLTKPDYQLTIDNDKCIGCELCIPACAYKALSTINNNPIREES